MDAKLKIGDKFKITHCDGYVANETVSKVDYWQNKYWYVCDSCACYNDEDLRNSDFEKIN
jgi:hypothetical protein